MKVVKESLSWRKQLKKCKYLAVVFLCFEDLICSTSLLKEFRDVFNEKFALSTKSVTFPSWHLPQWWDFDAWRDVIILFIFICHWDTSASSYFEIGRRRASDFSLITNFSGDVRIWVANLLHPVQLPNPLGYGGCITCRKFVVQTLT